MAEESKTGSKLDESFEDEFILGAPLMMPEQVWEYSLNAAFTAADVDESLYPEDFPVITDDGAAEACHSVDYEDPGPASLYAGQDPELHENWDHDHDGY